MQVLRVMVSPNGIIYLVRTQTFPQTNIPYLWYADVVCESGGKKC